MDRSHVFLDSSVIVAALLSPRGGSYYVLTQLNDRLTFHVNEYVLAEMQDLISVKFKNQPQLLAQFFLLLGLAGVETLGNPSQKTLRSVSSLISKKDAPILAGAMAACDYLVTLGNEFLSLDVMTPAREKGLTILRPGDLIALFRSVMHEK